MNVFYVDFKVDCLVVIVYQTKQLQKLYCVIKINRKNNNFVIITILFNTTSSNTNICGSPFSRNCKFISHNYDFCSCNSDLFSQNCVI